MSEHKIGNSTFDKAAYWKRRTEGLRGQSVVGVAASSSMTQSRQPHLRTMRRDKWKEYRRSERRANKASARGE